MKSNHIYNTSLWLFVSVLWNPRTISSCSMQSVPLWKQANCIGDCGGYKIDLQIICYSSTQKLKPTFLLKCEFFLVTSSDEYNMAEGTVIRTQTKPSPCLLSHVTCSGRSQLHVLETVNNTMERSTWRGTEALCQQPTGKWDFPSKATRWRLLGSSSSSFSQDNWGSSQHLENNLTTDPKPEPPS